MNADVHRELARAFGIDRVRCQVPLAPLTTLRVGGPADILFEPRNADEIVGALRIAHDAGMPVTMLGGGSNVLVGDRGIRGLVLRPRGGNITEAGGGRVSADAAVTINGLVRWTIAHGFAGVEAWAGTPGTVGGAIHGNAHYGGRLIGDMLVSLVLARRDGSTTTVGREEMEFAYDASRLQRTREVLVSAVFDLRPGVNPAALREIARQSLAHRKSTQPLDVPSAGCMFQNPGAADVVPNGIPRSAGALIDRAGLKGHRIGGATVSPVHANFIINDARATAADVRALSALCHDTVIERFGVDLKAEIVCLGEF